MNPDQFFKDVEALAQLNRIGVKLAFAWLDAYAQFWFGPSRAARAVTARVGNVEHVYFAGHHKPYKHAT